jgi:hypothetical protein
MGSTSLRIAANLALGSPLFLSLNVTSEGRDHVAPMHLLFSRAFALEELISRRDILESFRFLHFINWPNQVARIITRISGFEGCTIQLWPSHRRRNTTSSRPASVADRYWNAWRLTPSTYRGVGLYRCRGYRVSAHPATVTFCNPATHPFQFMWKTFFYSFQVHVMEPDVEDLEARYPSRTVLSARLHHGGTLRFEASFISPLSAAEARSPQIMTSVSRSYSTRQCVHLAFYHTMVLPSFLSLALTPFE